MNKELIKCEEIAKIDTRYSDVNLVLQCIRIRLRGIIWLIGEDKQNKSEETAEKLATEVGKILFEIVKLATIYGLDPTICLEITNQHCIENLDDQLDLDSVV